MTIGQKLIAGCLAIGLSISLASVLSVSPLTAGLDAVGQFHAPALQQIQHMHAESKDAIQESFAYIVSGEAIEKQEFLTWAKRFDAEAQRFWRIARFDALEEATERTLFERIVVKQKTLVENANVMFEEYDIGGSVRQATFHAYEDTIDTFASVIRELVSIEKHDAEEAQQFAVGLLKRAKWQLYVIGILAIVITSGIGYGFSRTITRPIKDLKDAAITIGQGNFDLRVHSTSNGEIGLLTQQFNEMLDRLNKSSEDQRRFYANASHELRTPLTIIRGEAEVALRAPEKPVTVYREALDVIKDVAKQSGRLVDELLFLARSEAGQIQYEMAELALSLLLEEVMRQSESLAVLKGVHQEVDVSRPSVVWGDPQRLRQLFFILMENAIKYTDPGGKVTLTLQAERDRARVLVSDTGSGIPAQELPHIFERFYRVKGLPGREGGVGLGLSIANSIVSAHEGELGVESALGQGTTFSVLLPHLVARG